MSEQALPPALPSGYALVRPQHDDLLTVARFIRDCDLADIGDVTWTEQQLRAEWNAPSFDASRDVWLLREPRGQLAACAHRVGSPPHTDDLLFLWTVPGRPHTTELVRFMAHAGEDRVLELTGRLAPRRTPVSLGVYCLRTETGSSHRAQLEAMRYRTVRQSYLMSIDTSTAPVLPPPAGVMLRALEPGQERAAHLALEEGFSDHFRYVPEPYEDWVARALTGDSFDPTLILLAWDGGEIAGVAQSRERDEAVGWIDALAVRRPWRGRGIAKALLTALVAELGRRGLPQVRLYVDAQNPHGALQLYEGIGMHVAREHDLLVKVLRAKTT